MEAWLAELGIGINSVSSILDDNMFQQYQQSETMKTTLDHFDEQLTAAFGEDFLYPLSGESDTTSPQWDIDNVIIDHFTSEQHISTHNNDSNINTNNNDNSNKSNSVSSDSGGGSQRSKNEEKDGKNKAVSGGRKRKRQPSQIQEHIIAERKRRQLLSQMFISLSAIVPGLKKMDKTSILGEAIKHMKQLQEKVKVLEEVAAKRTVESVVVVKKSHLIVDNDHGEDNDTSSTIDNNCVSGSGGGNFSGGDGGSGAYYSKDSLPEIEFKITDKTLLLRIYCEEQKGILAKLYTELDKHDMRVTNCSVIPFDNLALDITIVAQRERGFTNDIKDFVKSVRSALRKTSHHCRG